MIISFLPDLSKKNHVPHKPLFQGDIYMKLLPLIRYLDQKLFLTILRLKVKIKLSSFEHKLLLAGNKRNHTELSFVPLQRLPQ